MNAQYAGFLISGVGALAMGSTTYEWIAEHTGFLTDPTRWEYAQPTWVFTSRTLPRPPEGPDIRFVAGAVAPVHAEMAAAAGGNLWVVGGGDLAGQFYDAGLLDDLIIGIASVSPGWGAPLLPRRIVLRPAAAAGRGQGVRSGVRRPALRGRPPAAGLRPAPEIPSAAPYPQGMWKRRFTSADRGDPRRVGSSRGARARIRIHPWLVANSLVRLDLLGTGWSYPQCRTQPVHNAAACPSQPAPSCPQGLWMTQRLALPDPFTDRAGLRRLTGA